MAQHLPLLSDVLHETEAEEGPATNESPGTQSVGCTSGGGEEHADVEAASCLPLGSGEGSIIPFANKQAGWLLSIPVGPSCLKKYA